MAFVGRTSASSVDIDLGATHVKILRRARADRRAGSGYSQPDAEYNTVLDAKIQSIYEVSNT
jgi:hypothetical protein